MVLLSYFSKVLAYGRTWGFGLRFAFTLVSCGRVNQLISYYTGGIFEPRTPVFYIMRKIKALKSCTDCDFPLNIKPKQKGQYVLCRMIFRHSKLLITNLIYAQLTTTFLNLTRPQPGPFCRCFSCRLNLSTLVVSSIFLRDQDFELLNQARCSKQKKKLT